MTIALVAGQIGSAGSGGITNVSVTLPNNPATGNFVVAGVTSTDAGPFTVTDGNSNSYVATTNTPFTSGAKCGIYYLANAPANANKVITFNGSGVSNFYSLFVAEFSGVKTSSPLERDNTGSGTGTTVNSPSVTTTNNGDLLIGCCESNNGITSAGSPWTGVSTIPASGDYAEYFIQSSSGAQAVNFAQTNGTWGAIEAAFLAATGDTLIAQACI